MSVPFAKSLPVSLWRRVLSWDSHSIVAYVPPNWSVKQNFWLKATLLYEQLLSSVPYTTLFPICKSMFMFFVYWTIHQLLWSKITLSRFWFISRLGLKFRHVCQLTAKVQFYKAVDMKSLKLKAFSPDAEVIEPEYRAYSGKIIWAAVAT